MAFRFLCFSERECHFILWLDFQCFRAKLVLQEIKIKTGRDVLSNPKKRRTLLHMCEHAKRELTALISTNIELLPLIGEDLTITVSREKFEELCNDLLNKTIDVVRRVLAKAKVHNRFLKTAFCATACKKLLSIPAAQLPSTFEELLMESDFKSIVAKGLGTQGNL